MHTKLRNRLKAAKLNKLVFVHYDMRFTRQSQEEIYPQFNSIMLEYIFEDDDPLASWIEEREATLGWSRQLELVR